MYEPHERGARVGIYYVFVSLFLQVKCSELTCLDLSASPWPSARPDPWWHPGTSLELACNLLVHGYRGRDLHYLLPADEGDLPQGTQLGLHRSQETCFLSSTFSIPINTDFEGALTRGSLSNTAQTSD